MPQFQRGIFLTQWGFSRSVIVSVGAPPPPRCPGRWWDLTKPPLAPAGPFAMWCVAELLRAVSEDNWQPSPWGRERRFCISPGLWGITHLHVAENQTVWNQEASCLTLEETCQTPVSRLTLLWTPLVYRLSGFCALGCELGACALGAVTNITFFCQLKKENKCSNIHDFFFV